MAYLALEGPQDRRFLAERFWPRARDHMKRLTALVTLRKGAPGLLEALAHANPEGQLNLISDNLASHKSQGTCEWLAHHPRIAQTFIPKGACWLNLQEAYSRLFRLSAS